MATVSEYLCKGEIVPKYCVEMNYVIAYSTKFAIDCTDDETLDDVLGSMDSEFMEKNLGWNVCNYAEPVIENVRLFGPKDSNVAEVSKRFYDEFHKVQQQIYNT
jgi:hypothetical protein